MSQLVIGDALKQLASARTVNQMISALDWESLHLVSNGPSLPVGYLNPINHLSPRHFSSKVHHFPPLHYPGSCSSHPQHGLKLTTQQRLNTKKDVESPLPTASSLLRRLWIQGWRFFYVVWRWRLGMLSQLLASENRTGVRWSLWWVPGCVGGYGFVVALLGVI